jgi:putative DNA primase/helicase
LPTLTGIIEAPTILPHGSLIQAPGYDSETGLLLDVGDTHFPVVPSAPTRAQAEAALRTLSAPLKDFPFIDEPSRSVALAAVLHRAGPARPTGGAADRVRRTENGKRQDADRDRV